MGTSVPKKPEPASLSPSHRRSRVRVRCSCRGQQSQAGADCAGPGLPILTAESRPRGTFGHSGSRRPQPSCRRLRDDIGLMKDGESRPRQEERRDDDGRAVVNAQRSGRCRSISTCRARISGRDPGAGGARAWSMAQRLALIGPVVTSDGLAGGGPPNPLPFFRIRLCPPARCSGMPEIWAGGLRPRTTGHRAAGPSSQMPG